MFPILPILILLLMGPANAERLAVEGRLPAVLLAVHRSMVAPVKTTCVAQTEEETLETAVPRNAPRAKVAKTTPLAPQPIVAHGFAPGWPTRAGPVVA